jgi:two-component system chemotaxis sensor kinase CheA
VALILDVLGIGQLSGVLSESRDHSRAESTKSDGSHSEHQAFLLFRAGRFERLAVPLSLVARLEEFPANRVERAGGKLVVQYRERILELTPLAAVLGDQNAAAKEIADPTQVIVFAEGDQMAGLMVDQILDIHDETIRVGATSKQPRLSGSAVLGGKVTDFLDLPAVLRAADTDWSGEPTRTRRRRSSVLLADPSAFSRGLTRNYLELAGYDVLEASDTNDALAKLDRNAVDAVITAFDGPAARQLVEQLRRRPAVARTPVVRLNEAAGGAAIAADFFDASVDRFDRDALLASLQHLSDAIESAEAECVTK